MIFFLRLPEKTSDRSNFNPNINSSYFTLTFCRVALFRYQFSFPYRRHRRFMLVEKLKLVLDVVTNPKQNKESLFEVPRRTSVSTLVQRRVPTPNPNLRRYREPSTETLSLKHKHTPSKTLNRRERTRGNLQVSTGVYYETSLPSLTTPPFRSLDRTRDRDP